MYSFINGKKIKRKLVLVDKQLVFRLDNSSPLIKEMGEYIFKSGGKRLRPLFLLLFSEMFGYEGENDVDLAVAVEYIHTATLVHDDVIDKATIRRSRPTMNRKWDANSSVLFGDYIYAKTIEAINKFQNPKINSIFSNLTLQMILGELREYENNFNVELSEEEYLAITGLKTGELFASCASLAALISGADPDVENMVTESGRKIGIAFQIIDDLLDYFADENVLGKPVCSDLREGKMTLPALYLVQSGPVGEKMIGTVFKEKDFESIPVDDIRREMLKQAVPKRVKDKAAGYIKEGLDMLVDFSGTKPYTMFEKLTDYFITRNM